MNLANGSGTVSPGERSRNQRAVGRASRPRVAASVGLLPARNARARRPCHYGTVRDQRKNDGLSDICIHRAAARRAGDSPPYLAAHGEPLLLRACIGTMNRQSNAFEAV